MEIWRPAVHLQHMSFENLLIEVCIPHLHASFGTFCVQISQLFEGQGVFEECFEIHKYPFSKKKGDDFEIFRMFEDALGLY